MSEVPEIPKLELLREMGRELTREALHAVRRRAAVMVAPDLNEALAYERERAKDLETELARVRGVLEQERGLRQELIQQHEVTLKSQDETYRRLLKDAHGKADALRAEITELKRQAGER